MWIKCLNVHGCIASMRPFNWSANQKVRGNERAGDYADIIADSRDTKQSHITRSTPAGHTSSVCRLSHQVTKSTNSFDETYMKILVAKV